MTSYKVSRLWERGKKRWEIQMVSFIIYFLYEIVAKQTFNILVRHQPYFTSVTCNTNISNLKCFFYAFSIKIYFRQIFVPNFYFFYRIYQQQSAVLFSIFHVLSIGFGNLASAVFEALFQSKETHRVKN